MTEQAVKAEHLQRLHQEGDLPLIIYNAWDAGSAKTIAKARANAIATGSWSVAAAQGYKDGEDLPLDLAVTIIGRIATSTDLPVSADIEGAYASDPAGVAMNARRFIDAGVVGFNFEDRVVKGSGLYSVTDQAARIAAMRQACEEAGVPAYINARTDVFLGGGNADHTSHIGEALERAAAYEAAGASGFFVPGLKDKGLIAEICEKVNLPVNIMVEAGTPPIAELRTLGVRRVSFGPAPYLNAMNALRGLATSVFAEH